MNETVTEAIAASVKIADEMGAVGPTRDRLIGELLAVRLYERRKHETVEEIKRRVESAKVRAEYLRIGAPPHLDRLVAKLFASGVEVKVISEVVRGIGAAEIDDDTDAVAMRMQEMLAADIQPTVAGMAIGRTAVAN